MIKEFDSNACKVLRADVDKAFAEIAGKHGIGLKLGKITFTPEGAKLTVTAFTISAEGNNTNDKKSFDLYASWYGLEPSDYGKKINPSSGELTLVRIDTKKPKFPIIATNDKGTSFKLTEAMVVRELKRGKV